MPRSMLAAALSLPLAVACTKTSDNPPVVTAPMASGVVTTPGVDGAAATAPTASTGGAVATSGDAAGADGGVPAELRACQTDTDCVAVPRVGCCHNGWMEAVNVAKQDAYARSFVCPTPRPVCPMYIVHETRVARCDAGSHLCTMVAPAQP